MSEWTYRRGVWTHHPDYPASERAAKAQERVRKWGYQSRWKKFPQLGPIPEKWMDVGPVPRGGSYMNELLMAIYEPALVHFFNQSSPLMKYLEKT